MKRKILPVLIASLALGTSPLCLLSASAQDAAPILPKKGATQGDQPQPGTSQQPSGGEPSGTGSGQETPSGGTGNTAPVQPDSGAGGTSGSSPQGTEQPSTQGQDTSKPSEGSSTDGAAPSGSEAGKSSGEAPPPEGKAKPDEPAGDTGSGNAGSTTGGDTTSTPQSPDTGTTGGNTSPDTSDQSSKGTGTGTTNVNISVEQKTEIQEAVKEVRIEPVREVDFTVSVGTAIPQTVRLEPLPPRIIKIVPQYEGYRFFILADGRIVIVEPSTFKIVYIIA